VLEARNADQIREGLRGVRATSARNWLVASPAISSEATRRAAAADHERPDHQCAQSAVGRISALGDPCRVDAVERFQAALLTAIGRFRAARRVPLRRQ
jgi:hypothetical protein